MNYLQQKKENIFLKALISLGKILILSGLVYLFIGLLFIQNTTQLIIGFFILIFITLPTVFIFFFKEKYLSKHPKFITFWKIFRVIYVISIILYIFMTIFGMWRLNEQSKTQKAIEFINSKKITLDDVMGKNLPPVPDQKLNDSTIAGIDANKNYIRDDVELVIFQKYPDSAKIRAAELQYAQEIEDKIINVFNNDTWVAMAKKENNGISCIIDLSFSNYTDTKEQIYKSDDWMKEIENLVFNNDIRKQKRDGIDKFYQASYVVGDGKCDINILSLPN